MQISESIELARSMAGNFRGKADSFFKELRLKSKIAADLMESEYSRFLAGTSKRKSLHSVFQTIAPSAGAAVVDAALASGDFVAAFKAAQVHAEQLVTKADTLLAPKTIEQKTRLENLGREVATLATSPDPKVSQPLVKGITKALDAQQKLDAKLAEARAARSPAAKLAILRAAKHDSIVEANAEHEKRCATERDRILSNMRNRMAGK